MNSFAVSGSGFTDLGGVHVARHDISWTIEDVAADADTIRDIAADIVRNAPDHVALTGDIVNVAAHAEFVAAAEALEATMTGPDFRINLLAAYDAEDELRSAYRRAQAQECDINDAFEIGRVDMVIRTTAEPLLSGFLPYQSQYAQLLFLDTPLNDLDAGRVDKLVADYRLMPQLHGR